MGVSGVLGMVGAVVVVGAVGVASVRQASLPQLATGHPPAQCESMNPVLSLEASVVRMPTWTNFLSL